MAEKNNKKKEGSNIAKIEAVLFASGDPVGVEKMQSFLKLNKKQWEDEIEALNEKYNRENSGLQIIQKKGKIQLVTKAGLSKSIATFLGKAMNEELSKSSLETLAVVAYRGPVTRVQIEYIRGVNCSYALRVLSLRGIIERKDNPLDSRSYLYEISMEFLKSLGLKKVEDLEDYENLKKELPLEGNDESKNITENNKE